MTYQELQRAVKIEDGKVTISHSNLTSNVSDFLTAYYNSEPIVITGAEPGPGDGEKQTVVIFGKSSFLNVPDAPVTASFSLDTKGNVLVLIKYQLRGETPTPNAWTFSRSFPTLPTVLDYDIYAMERPFLDGLYLFNTYFLVSTHARQEPEFQVPLKPGVNFVSKMRPEGMLGVLEYTLGDAEPQTLYGTVRIPKPTDKTLALKPLERVWNRSNAPGIHLQAALGVDCKLGKMVFNQAFFRVYSPPSTEWQEQNDTFEPMHGYVGKLQIPSADIEVDLEADLKWGLPEARLFGKCEGVTLGKLAHLMDIAGTDGLTASLPKEIQKATDALEKLELMEVSLDIGLIKKALTIKKASFTIGMPNLNWQVWEDHFKIDSLACRFEASNPFGARSAASTSSTSASSESSIGVTVMGTMKIEGVPVSILARSEDGFILYAKLEGGQTIPLKKLMQRYVPGVPAPSDLTVDSLDVIIGPGQFYAMSAALAGKPKPWVIPVGKMDLTISDVVFDFTYPKGGPVSGSFAGMAAFGKDLVLAINYSVPGSFVLRGDFYDIKLRQLISRLCHKAGSLPSGFDLTFEHASVLVQGQDGKYVLQLASQVKGVGTFAFELRKVGTQWGFAGGFSLTASPSKLSGLKALEVFEKGFKLQKFMMVMATFDAASFKFPDMAQFNNPAIASQGSVALPSSGLTAGTYIFAEWRIDTKDKQQKLLKKFLGLSPTLAVTLYLGKNPAKDMRLFVNYKTKIQGHPMTCQFGVMIQNRQTSIFLDGHMTLKIQKQPVTFDVTMLFVPTGMFLSGTMKGTVKFGGLKLSNVALMTVVPWGGIPSLGIAATISTKRFSSSVALFFDSSNPSRSVLAGSVSDLTLKDVAEELSGSKLPKGIGNVLGGIGVEGTNAFTMPGSVSTALDDLDVAAVSAAFKTKGKVTIPSTATRVLLVVGKKGAEWFLTDLANNMRHYQIVKKGRTITVTEDTQVYCAPQTTNIGTLEFRKGFFLNGTLRVMGVEATACVVVSPLKGVAIDSSINKALVLVNPQFFKLSAANGRGGPVLSVSTFNQPNHKVREFRKPHVYVNGQVILLGLKSTCFVEITTSGGKFLIAQKAKATLRGGVISARVLNEWSISGQVGANVLAAGGSVTLAVSGKMNLAKLIGGAAAKEMGSLKLNMKVSGTVAVALEKGKASAMLSGSCLFQGERVRFKTTLNTKGADLARIEKVVEKELEKEFKKLLSVGEKWAKWANKGLVEGVKDAKQAARVMRGVYKKSAKDTAKALRAAGHSVDDVGGALGDAWSLGEGEMKDALKGAGYAARSVDQFAGKTFKQATKAVSKTAKSAGKKARKTGKKVGKAVGSIGKKKKKRK